MGNMVGVTWNRSGVYVSGISEKEFLSDFWPVIRFDYPRLKTQENFGMGGSVLRIHGLSGQDELVGKWIIQSLVNLGWELCDPPSNAPVWAWGLWVRKPQESP